MKFTNPFRSRAAAAVEQVQAERARPQLDDIEADDFVRAQEAARLATLSERTRRVQLAQRRADDLARRADRLDTAVAEHQAAEKREAARVTTLGKELAGSRDKLVAAVQVADLALAAAYEAAQAHDGLVQQSAGELRAAGLADRYADGDEVVTFDTGGSPGQGLRLAGRDWTRVEPAAVLWRALHGALRAQLGEQAAFSTRYTNGVGKLLDHTAGLLAAAPLPKAYVPATPAWRSEVDELRREVRPELTAAPPRDDLEARREAHAEQEQARKARAQYAVTRAELVRTKGEEFVLEVEAQMYGNGQPFGMAGHLVS